MLSTLALCVALAVRLDTDPPTSPGPRLQPFPWRNLEEYRVQQLELARSRRAFMEENIALFEWALNFKKWPLYTPEEAVRKRHDLEKWCMSMEFVKRYEQELELWGEERERNPGSATDKRALDRIGKLLKEEE